MELHPKPKPPIQINRPLIITIVIVVVTVLLLAIIGALTATNRVKNNDTPSTKIATDKFVISSELKELPEDYSDIDAIKKYSSDSSSSQMALLLQRFNELQGDYALLKRQLLTKRTPEKPPEDPQLQQIKKGSMVFGNLGSGVDNLVGPQADKSRSSQSPDGKETIVPTPQQEEFFKSQAHNEQWLAVMKGKDDPKEIYDMHNMVKPISPLRQILAGTLIPATLITGVDTTLAGTLIAQVRSNIYDTITGKYLLIPKGSKLLGEYETRIVTGQRRVLLTFNRIIRPDGSSILLGKTLGVDAMGQSGIEGNVDNHWARIIGAATISTILGVGTSIAGDRSSDSQNQYPRSMERAASGAASSINKVGENIVNRDLNIQPTITLYPGHQFDVAVRKDMILTVYKPKKY